MDETNSILAFLVDAFFPLKKARPCPGRYLVPLADYEQGRPMSAGRADASARAGSCRDSFEAARRDGRRQDGRHCDD